MGPSVSASKRSVKATILGQACSKANSRRLVTIGGKPRFIKSKEALAFARAIEIQAPRLNELLTGDLEFRADIYYRSRRPDLDESIILDALEGIWYANDRAVKSKVVRKYLDKDNPRCDVEVREIEWNEKGPDHGLT
tara:strand:- start:191 stop:601 length:411 start_codon:yes stop_codon:yes gene_type:complete